MRNLGFAIAEMLLVGLVVLGQQAGQVTAQLSPVPLYPRDGNIPPELKEYFVFLDPETWDLVVSYPEGKSLARKEFKVGLAKHVVPSLAVELRKQTSGSYSYRYTVSNQGRARQAIRTWYLTVPQPKAPDPADPSSRTANAPTVPWKQIDYAFSPGNWSKRWDAQEINAHIRPGFGPQRFEIQTENKPGFTTAYFQGPTPQNEVSLSGDMPQGVLDQLGVCQDLRFNSASLLTLGPMFGPETPKTVIAADFHVGISMLVNRGVLDAESAFVKQALSSLRQLIERQNELGGEVERLVQFSPLTEKPSTQAEREIYDAMKLALDIQN